MPHSNLLLISLLILGPFSLMAQDLASGGDSEKNTSTDHSAAASGLAAYALIPAPVALVPVTGYFSAISIDLHVDASLEPSAEAILQLLQATRSKTSSTAQISLELDTLLHSNPEYYRLEIQPGSIRLTATTSLGILHGIQTLAQLARTSHEGQIRIPACRIEDFPRFPYRGMHLDVCRHFFPVSFIKKYIDLLAQYKFNTFHWHLTEDQGWRIEIKRYPRLTEVGAWRSGSMVGPYANQKYDTLQYGGFYTQEEIKEVVAYATARGITVMPEIELPGHSLAALAAYPELSCAEGPFEVARGWGVFDDVYCPKEETFVFLENVLAEVIDLFPSPYIHIGGDECPKVRWKTCPHCQKLMKKEGLKDEHELQSYFIQRIERFVNSKERKIIGWDEILEGGLAPNAAVMSWRGTEGGIAAARAGHYAVMTPGSHCYFDHYQGDPAFEPLAIGGFTPVTKVYSYEPVPAELNPSEAQFILGAQGNVWTEYILDEDHVEYMAVTRMIALSEVLWSPKEKRNEADFLNRLENEFVRLESQDVHYSKSLYQVQLVPERGDKPGRIRVRAQAPLQGKPTFISWTKAEQTHTTTSSRWVDIDADSDITARLLPENHAAAIEFPMSSRSFRFNRATARPIALDVTPHERYNTGGAFTLVDGISAGDKRVNTEWLGWQNGVTITLDLGAVQKVNGFRIGALNETHSWIHLPKEVTLASSLDGKTFSTPTTSNLSLNTNTKGGRNQFECAMPLETRFIRLSITHPGVIPDGMPGAGYPAWVFLDEIEVH